MTCSAIVLPAARFACVGTVNAMLGYVLFRLFLHGFAAMLHPAALAQAAAYGVGVGISFVANRRWTFRSMGRVRGELPRFVASHGVSLALSSALMQVGVASSWFPVAVCYVLVVSVTTVLNFTMQRYWVFPHVATTDANRRISGESRREIVGG